MSIRVPDMFQGDPAQRAFFERVRNEPRLHAIVQMLMHDLLEARLTTDDVLRCATLAVQEYFLRRNVPLTIRIEKNEEAAKLFDKLCGACRRPMHSGRCPSNNEP